MPFLFVSSSASQSMYYGPTNRKIRSYFRALRTAARKGGAIGFSRRSTPSAVPLMYGRRRPARRCGWRGQRVARPAPELRRAAPFDPRAGMVHRHGQPVPAAGQGLRKPRPTTANVLIVGATNRAADLDPALVRPGRFDRSVHFGLPGRKDRREIIDYYLAKKSHVADLDDPTRLDCLAAMTAGYSPVMIEHLFDEALIWALRRGRPRSTGRRSGCASRWSTPTRSVGIATHEAGHATVANLVGKDRKLVVLSIISARTPSACWPIPISRSASPRPARRSWPASRSPWAGWWPKRPTSARRNRRWRQRRGQGAGRRGRPPGRPAMIALLDDAKAVALRRIVSNRHILEALRDAPARPRRARG